MPNPLISGGILAGGQGSRLGGVDKGWLDYQGKPLIAHVLDRLAPQVGQIMLNANRNQPRYAELGYPVVNDAHGGYPGPLAGIYALLNACETPWLLIAPCDAPFLPLDLASRLFQALETENAVIAIARDAKRKQPTHALIRQSLLADLDAFLQRGERKVMAWYAQHKHCFVEFDERAFVNINTPEDLAVKST